MGDWPLLGDEPQYIAIPNLSTAAHATPNTKGAWVEVIASTPIEAGSIFIAGAPTSAVTTMLVDIGIGPEGQEIVIIPNMVHCYINNAYAYRGVSLFLPLSIPKGTRIAIRSQAYNQAGKVLVAIHLMAGGALSPKPLNIVDTYGADTSASTGTTIDPGTTINTKGDWVEFSGSCNPMKALFMAINGFITPAYAYAKWLVDVGIGAEGSEVVLIPDITLMSGIGGVPSPASLPPFPVDIPAGTRISIRTSCTINTNTIRLLNLTLHGMR